jgi:hypothetical protein
LPIASEGDRLCKTWFYVSRDHKRKGKGKEKKPENIIETREKRKVKVKSEK